MLLFCNVRVLGSIKWLFKNVGEGYNLFFQKINVSDYFVLQDCKWVFFIGYCCDLGKKFEFFVLIDMKFSLKLAIGDLVDMVILAKDGNYINGSVCWVFNYEYFIGGFFSFYMLCNCVCSWDEVFFIIQVGGWYVFLYFQVFKMEIVDKDIKCFVFGKEDFYCWFSVCEVVCV